MGFNSAFKGLKCPLKCPLNLILLTWRIWLANNASKWQMGFNWEFKELNLAIDGVGGGGWSTARNDSFTPGKDPVPIV